MQYNKQHHALMCEQSEYQEAMDTLAYLGECDYTTMQHGAHVLIYIRNIRERSCMYLCATTCELLDVPIHPENTMKGGGAT